MSGYTSFHHYNIVLGCQALRLSIHNEQGDEFYALVPADGTGRQNRTLRDKALDALLDAIERGDPPGVVQVN